jgi:EAL domain-containing protein (putative c-di-GMP-specific phosphodiesterase class I)
MTQPDTAAAIVKALKRTGFALAIDDFGTGYSSLSYVHQFQVDQVKIDRSFIINLATSSESRSIVKAIVAMCTSLGLETLAEGVETEEQLQILKELGCNKVQGYLISQPLPADEFETFLRKNLGC